MTKHVFTVARRELAAYFNSPVAYVFIVVFLLVTCGIYMTGFFLQGLCSMRSLFTTLPLVLIVFVPALTMRLWAEERKTGTLALLFSLPTSSTALCLGKFIAAFVFGATALAGTLTIPVMLGVLGNPDPGPIAGGYIGSLFLLALLLSLGMTVSALFSDQIVAFIITLVFGFGCFLLGTDFIPTFLDGWVNGLGTFLRDTLGIPSHFNSFAKGVIDLGDVLFYLSYTVLFLMINVLILEGHLRLRTARGFSLGVALLLGIGIFLNGVVKGANLPRIDLTEDKLYTVSPATKRVLERLKVPITVTYYVTSRDRLPTPMKDIARDVKDILEELANLSPKFTFKVVDPARIPDKIQDLQKKGIVPFSAQTIEQDTVNIKRIYSSIAVAYLDKKEEIIPQIVPQSLGSLEYELISKIYRLTLDHEPKVVLWAPKRELDLRTLQLLQQMGRPIPPRDDFQTLGEILRDEGYEVIRQGIDKDHPLPGDTRLLILMGPERLDERQRYEIYRFLRAGGSVILAAQGHRYTYDEGPRGLNVMAQQIPLDHINELISPLGVQINKDMLFDQRHMVLQITSQRRMGLFTALVQTPVNFPMQIQILPDQMNQDLSITNRVQGLLYLWGSALDLEERDKGNTELASTVLFTSSPSSWTVPYHFGPLTPEDLHPHGSEGLRPRPLALLLEGTFPNPFEGKDMPEWPGTGEKDKKQDSKKEEKEESKDETQPMPAEAKPGRMLVVGCSEMFTDTVIGALGNAAFALNSVDALALGDELIHVRTKAMVQRFIPPVSTNAKILWRAVTIFLIPSLWIAYGIARAVRRKKAREHCEFAV